MKPTKLLNLIICFAGVLVACDDGIDKQAPRAAIASPVSNASLTGQGTAQITAADDIGVTAVRLYAQGKDNAINRVSLGSAVVEPFVIGFDTRRLPNGSEVQLVAVAEDGSGKLGESDPSPSKRLNILGSRKATIQASVTVRSK